MSSVIRIGTVSKVNYEDGTIEVAYEDRDGSVTDEICVVSNALYRMPVVGAMVCVLHNSDSQEMGTCIGTFWNEDNKPVGGKKQRYRYDYNDKKGKAFEQYDGDSGDYEEKIDGNAKETIGKNLDFTVGGDVTFKVGASTVKVCQSGTIEITGTTVKITGATVNISGGSGDCKIPDDAKFKAEVTNNALDSSPVWQDATTEVKKGVNIVFENKTATNGAAFNFRVSVERGESGEGGYIEAVSGAFQ